MANYNNKAQYNIGDTYVNWTIIGDADKNGYNGGTYVKCKCVCGTIKDVDLHNLKRGYSKSCGCIKPTMRTHTEVKIGDMYGRLTVIDKEQSDRGYWKCICQCGNMTSVRGYRLYNGTTKSCGCLRENLIEAHRLKFKKSFEEWCLENNLQHVLDLWDYDLNEYPPSSVGFKSGKEFYFKCPNNLHESEKFQISNAVNNFANSRYFFLCRKCMLQSSQPEEHINHFLYKFGYNYIRQHKFNDCKDIYPLPFDFYLPDFNILIEYDGEHHYYPVNHNGYSNKERLIEKFNETQKHDEIKTKYCRKKKIKLIRIPYYKVNDYDDIQYFLWDKLEKYGAIEELNVG